MKNNVIENFFVIGITIIMLGFIFGASANAINVQNIQYLETLGENLSNGYTNLTEQEAFDLLSDTGNGIQIPIDVRTNQEWNDVRIDTPIPENPRHYCLNLFQNETLLQQFMTLYDGMEIIIYCAAGFRSFIVTNILIDNGFIGTIYNMPGGISGWISEALPTMSGGHTNITSEESWELLTDTANGLQIPIDVRTDGEWIDWHIDTPSPENPKHYPNLHLSNEAELKEFMEFYEGREIIIYCHSGYRSFVATSLLVENEFNGTIYNMLGGITGWDTAGYLTVPNRQPNKPTINGEIDGTAGEVYSYTFVATDLDEDILYYNINWSDDTGEINVGPYESGEELNLDHSWDEEGTYIIKAKATDRYGNESELATLEVTMPKNKVLNGLFINSIARLPNLLPILQRLLQILNLY
jgi:rhodanese-related sulfurtransferase